MKLTAIILLFLFCSCTANKKVASIKLDGTKSYDPDGKIIDWGWRQIAGPAVTLINANKEKSGALVKQEAWYSFELTVTDDNGAKGKDTTTILFTRIRGN